ncbi:kinase-like domain-containing protein [Myxozyma melibiosi]|uniref:Kinase-like domain-containing protein n=1 Tax=Myxozyma melibiosi TaxID=54550 RepID=A0ABR1F876_9ASCO
MHTAAEKKIISLLHDREFTVGRRSSCDQVVAHSAVSSIHFTIYTVKFDDSSAPLVYCWDRSRNGTFHNRRIIGHDRRILLSDGDELEIRHACSFEFHQQRAGPWTAGDPTLDEDRPHIKDYEISSRALGHGTFGRVLLATERKSGRQVACKIIDTRGNSIRMIKAKTEIAILQRLRHPNVVSVYDGLVIRNRIYILEDLITGGDLFSYLSDGENMSSIPEAEALLITFQILKALEYLHRNNVIHRDLKLDNILRVSQHPGARVVLIDFGISKYVRDGARRMTTVVGTPEYAAPEVGFAGLAPAAGTQRKFAKTEKSGYDKKCDLWSLGVILHILLSGISPFYDVSQNSKRMALKAVSGKLDLSNQYWKDISPAAKSLVRRLLCVDPETRYSVEECFEHSWIANQLSVLESIYQEKIVAGWQPPPDEQHRLSLADSQSADGDGGLV